MVVVVFLVVAVVFFVVVAFLVVVVVFVVVVVGLVVARVVVAFFGCFHVASPFVLVCVRNYSQYNPEFVQSQSIFKHFQRIYTKNRYFSENTRQPAEFFFLYLTKMSHSSGKMSHKSMAEQWDF